jgi:hypothetical protein
VALLTPPFALGAAGQVLSGKVLRHAVGAAWRPSGAALSAASGVVQGPVGSMMEATLVSPTLLRVNPGTCVVQGTFATDQGQYVLTNDAPVDLPVPGQSASQYRRGLLVAEAADSQVAGVTSTAETDRALLRVITGNLSPTAPGALPPIPDTALALGEVVIPPTGQAVTYTPYNPRTVARGGVQPVYDDSSTVPGHGGEPGAYVDQLRMRAGRLERWSGSAWEWPKTPQGVIYRAEYAGPAITLSNASAWLDAFTGSGIYVPAGRHVRLEFSGAISCDTAGGAYGFVINFGGGQTPPRRGVVPVPVANLPVHFTITRPSITPEAGAQPQTFISGGRLAGTGTFQLRPDDLEGPVQYVITDQGAV